MRKILFMAGCMLAFPIMAQEPKPNDLRGDSFAKMCRAAVSISDPTVLKPEDPADAVKFAMDAGYCLGYLNGFFAGKSFVTYRDGMLAKKLSCIPANVTVDQMARVVAKTYDDHPEYGNAPAISFAAGSLARVWPCSQVK